MVDSTKENKDEVKKHLPLAKKSFDVNIINLIELLDKIKPLTTDSLFWDIIGRIVWNAIATTTSIKNLILYNDHYGIISLLRKLFECQLLIDYLFLSDNKSKIIARVISYSLFSSKEKIEDNDAINSVEKLVENFNEDEKIVEYFKYYLDRGPKHWHWSEKSFYKLIKLIENKNYEKIGDFGENIKIELLQILHRYAHIDLDLGKNYFHKSVDGTVEYISPFKESDQTLYGALGLGRLIVKNICRKVDDEYNLINTT